MARIAIVGAGIAGTAAARRLTIAGFRVRLFDKGNGVGGRMATRRLPDGRSFDHGAQYLTAHDPDFCDVVQMLTDNGAVGAWGEAGWSVGVPSMNAVVHRLAAGLDVSTRCAVTKLIRDRTGWQLADAAGAMIGDVFDGVLVTAPAPQALTLTATAGISWPELSEALEPVRYAPSWALMIAHAGQPLFDGTHHRERDMSAPIAWIARGATKPGRDTGGETLVVHASADWSRLHLERQPEEIVPRMVAELSQTYPSEIEIQHAAAHRWRYAMVEDPVGKPCLWSPDLCLGVAGDSCLGGRIEAAYLSGIALAERVIASG